ncbi:MAG: hypothetical protein RMH97_10885 [Verrucomicrobiales bacterium]|nr:hypothetical protein [Verrucomicrobiales bacterium]
MSSGIVQMPSLQLERRDLTRLGWAFFVSLLLHASCFGGYKLGAKLHVWERIDLANALRPASEVVTKILGLNAAVGETATIRDVPVVFVDVNPVVASTEPPKSAKYYSDRHSVAANPDADKDTGVPKIDGTQTLVPKTHDVPRPRPVPLQPLPAPASEPEPGADSAARVNAPPGDLVLAKPQVGPETTSAYPSQGRPRTVREALARAQAASGLAGQKMKQDGGVKRRAVESSLDVMGFPFGDYDRAVVEAVQNRWFYLLDSGDFARGRKGKVVIEFNLHYDGRVSDMNVVENTVNELLCLLCQKAILDPAPYPRWPAEMRRMIGSDTRHVRFTFYYD